MTSGTWLCARELHALKVRGTRTANLEWKQDGLKEDGSVRWQPVCRACKGLTCPAAHDQDAIVSLLANDGTWYPACTECLADSFASDAATWSTGEVS